MTIYCGEYTIIVFFKFAKNVWVLLPDPI